MRFNFGKPVQISIAKSLQIDRLDSECVSKAIAEIEEFYRSNKRKKFEIFVDVAPAILGISESKLSSLTNSEDEEEFPAAFEELLVGLSRAKAKSVGWTNYEYRLIQHSFVDVVSDLDGNIVKSADSNDHFIKIFIFDTGKHKPTNVMHVRFCCVKNDRLHEYLTKHMDFLAMCVDLITHGLGSVQATRLLVVLGLISLSIMIAAFIFK